MKANFYPVLSKRTEEKLFKEVSKTLSLDSRHTFKLKLTMTQHLKLHSSFTKMLKITCISRTGKW